MRLLAPVIAAALAAVIVVVWAAVWAAVWPGAPAHARRPQQVTVVHRDVGEVPILGPRHAPVTVDFFIDLSSRRSLRLHASLKELAERHPRRLRIAYWLSTRSSPTMVPEAALEAFAQDRFMAFLDELALFTNTHERATIRRGPEMQGLCERAGVDYRRVVAAWDDGRHLAALDRSDQFARRRYAPSAPSVLVNGVVPPVRASSLLHPDELEKVYDRAYAEARALMDDGVPVQNVYELMLRRADREMPAVPITAGAVDGPRPTKHRGILSNPPLVSLPPGGHRLGPEDARIAVHFFCNFASLHCAREKLDLDKLQAIYPAEITVVFHHLFPKKLDADEVAALIPLHRAALCADDQGMFLHFYDLVFRDQGRRGAADPTDKVSRIVADIELDRRRFAACLADARMAQAVMDQVQSAHARGILHSPAVVVGGHLYTGSKSLQELRNLVQQELLPGVLEQAVPTLEAARSPLEIP